MIGRRPASLHDVERPENRGPFDALTIFNIFWAAGVLTHQAYHSQFGASWPDVFLNATSLALLLRPSSLACLAAVAVAQITGVYLDLPEVCNHWLLIALGNLAILVVLIDQAVRARALHLDRSAFYRSVAPPLRILMIATYAFSFLAKVNRDFLNPAISCAAEMYPRVAYRITILPLDDWTIPAAVWGTLGIEAFIPLVLLFRRTRVAGVFVALAFHLLMGVAGHYDFSGAAYGFLFLFLPDDTPNRLRAFADRHPWLGAMGNGCARFSRSPLALPVVIGATYALMIEIRRVEPPVTFARRVWVVFAIVMFGVWLASMLAERRTARSAANGLVPIILVAGYPLLSFLRQAHSSFYWPLLLLAGGAAGWALLRVLRKSTTLPLSSHLSVARPVYLLAPLLLTLNCLAPYVGLKTEMSFTMFSNLMTEGENWNHLVLPSGMRIFGMQDEVIRILDSSDSRLAAYARRHEGVVLYHFQQLLSRRADDVSLVYERSGRRYDVPRLGDEPALRHAPGTLAAKLLDFRTVPYPNTCLH